MNTRRSPRNQETLFRELFKPPVNAKPPATPQPLGMRAEQIRLLLADPNRCFGKLYKGELTRELAKIEAALHVRERLAKEP